MKKPMSLKDLPAYTDGLQQRGEYGEGVLVEMGTIETPRSNIFRNLALASSLCIVLGFVAFNFISEDITVSTKLNAEQVSSLVSDNGGQIVTIKQNEDKTYKIKVLAFWKKSFLENMRKNKDIEFK